MISLFHDVSRLCSKATTEKYSTSFSSAIKLLHKDMRVPIFNIYGLVRFADEIVDTFHDYDKVALLAEFKQETYIAIERGISLNPIINSFQLTVNKYKFPIQLVEAFFNSMEMDLNRTNYNSHAYKEYIYGSAEVIGLMCLFVFCEGDIKVYESLKPYAQSLGAAFQKVNFLRDVKSDYLQLNRNYFPGIDFSNFTDIQKRRIEEEIANDFTYAYKGILQLPVKSRFGVYVAYKYYLSLFNKIKKKEPSYIKQHRIRIADLNKILIIAKAGLKSQLNLL